MPLVHMDTFLNKIVAMTELTCSQVCKIYKQSMIDESADLADGADDDKKITLTLAEFEAIKKSIAIDSYNDGVRDTEKKYKK